MYNIKHFCAPSRLDWHCYLRDGYNLYLNNCYCKYKDFFEAFFLSLVKKHCDGATTNKSIKQHSCFITPSRVFRKGKKHDSRQKRQENQIKNSRGGVVVAPAVVRGAEVVGAFGEALNGVI